MIEHKLVFALLVGGVKGTVSVIQQFLIIRAISGEHGGADTARDLISDCIVAVGESEYFAELASLQKTLAFLKNNAE